MITSKKHYVDTIRKKSAYPSYRKLIKIITGLGYVLIILGIIGAIVITSNIRYIGIGVFLGMICIFLLKIWRELSLVLIDIADSILDANRHTAHIVRNLDNVEHISTNMERIAENVDVLMKESEDVEEQEADTLPASPDLSMVALEEEFKESKE